MDVGLSLPRSQPPPAPLLFDISTVPQGTWWLHVGAAVTGFDLWRPG